MPIAELNPEIVNRTFVGWGDIVLALAAGSAGSLAFTTGVSGAVIGVMIAVALLPPLIAAGVLLGLGEITLAVGAFLEDVHEVGGTGTLFPDETGNSMVHMHISAGRNESTKTGCIREGIRVWEVMEIVLMELVYSKGKRLPDKKTGLKLLNL